MSNCAHCNVYPAKEGSKFCPKCLGVFPSLACGGEPRLTSPAFLALLATIRKEYSFVETWASLATSFEDMPQGEDFAQLVRDLEAVEPISSDLHIEQDLPKFGDSTFTTAQVREAFWKTFHMNGEYFFDYLSDEETNTKSTEDQWNEFRANLPW